VSAVAEAIVVSEPGVYDEMPEGVYHGDPVPGGSLSASGAKLLLPPSCPALYRYRRDHPKESAEFDFGTAAHKFVLGLGPEITVIDALDWRTKAAQEARKDARAKGVVPLLISEFSEIADMARAIEHHPVAGPLFRPGRGQAEQSMFWQDAEYGIWRRARLDWQLPGTRLIITDYKTTPDASPAAIRKHVANFGYHLQAAQYADGARALGLDDDPAFLFVFQERTPPYLVTIAELDDEALETGRGRLRLACEMFRDCTQAGYWPGYSQDIELISLPPWAARPVEDLY
jgi:PDDEXK-like domain of unknown function (DUF3799)